MLKNDEKGSLKMVSLVLIAAVVVASVSRPEDLSSNHTKGAYVYLSRFFFGGGDKGIILIHGDTLIRVFNGREIKTFAPHVFLYK
jgi:hypothetical protein